MRALRILMISVILVPVVAAAAKFPDVPDGHTYQAAIEGLAAVNVINGNPDGTFKPLQTVNRAAMLKMLYRAAGIVPEASATGCLKDVEKGSWYESFVCNAVKRQIVQGFNDGTFRPATEVTRAQAVKMTMLTFAFSVPELTDQTKSFLKFIDVATSAWYTKFLNAAFSLHILPIAGQGGSYFYPDTALLRGEAAAYIWNALQAHMPSQTSSSAELASSSAPSGAVGSSSSVRKAQEAPPPPPLYEVAFPFTTARQFDGKKSSAYHFNLSASTVASITASLADQGAGALSCRLYRLTPDGYSLEYYLGVQEGATCRLLVALAPGAYQLQLQPAVSGASYTIDAKAGKGDGNDGFSQAARIQQGTFRTEFLDGNDLQDWFTFTVPDQKEQPTMTLTVTSSSALSCLIYPMDDVDIFGFTGPQCGVPYQYPSGTYYVGVGHGLPLGAKQTYTIQLK